MGDRKHQRLSGNRLELELHSRKVFLVGGEKDGQSGGWAMRFREEVGFGSSRKALPQELGPVRVGAGGPRGLWEVQLRWHDVIWISRAG